MAEKSSIWGRLFGRSHTTTEQRSIDSLPWNYGGSYTTGLSPERALSLIPVYASVRLLSETVSSLPLKAYREIKAGRVEIPDPQLIARPSIRDDMGAWLSKIMVSLALRGNAYGLVLSRDGFGFPTTIEIVNPDDVYVDEQNPLMPVYYHQGKVVPPGDMFHVPWIVQPGHVVALSPISSFATSMGVGIEANQYGKRWFDRGGMPTFVLQNENHTLPKETITALYEQLDTKNHQGAMLLGQGWNFQTVNVSLQESMFLETIQANAGQIASIYGVPPHMVGGSDPGGESMTYANVEQRMIEFLTLSLRPWLVRLERHISDVLPEKQFVKFNVDALLRVDLKTRYEAHQIALSAGFRNVDEVRELEELSKLPNGQGQNFNNTNTFEEAPRG